MGTLGPGTVLPPELETPPIAVPVPGGALPAEYQNLEAPPPVTTLDPQSFADAPIALPTVPVVPGALPPVAPPPVAPIPGVAVAETPPIVPPAAHAAPAISSVPGAGRLRVPGAEAE